MKPLILIASLCAFALATALPAEPRATQPNVTEEGTQKAWCWQTASTKTVHLPGCRYHGTTKGTYCAPDAGKPCKVCHKADAADVKEGAQK